jgi:DNA-binding Lrp family transcriptional regulator
MSSVKKQAMFRVNKDKNNPYVMLNKGLLNDERLSWKAKGILSYLLSLPDDWQIYELEVQKHSVDGIDSLKTGIKELIKNGYIKREQIRNDKGHFIGYEYQVYEVSTESGKSNDGESNNGESHTTNNDLSNNDLTNNEYIHLPSEDEFVSFYLEVFKRFKGKDHVSVKVSDYYRIQETIDELKSNGITIEEWEEAVIEHFENLPKSNNGNILAFLKAARRYFDVEMIIC